MNATGVGQIYAGAVNPIAFRLLELLRNAAITADLWVGVHDGHILAAKRQPTFELWLQAGAKLIFEGRRRFDVAAGFVIDVLGEELAGSLLRRTRYLAMPHKDEPPSGSISSACVFDAGPGRY